eukprot:2170772-Rhodomonas_salina.1
MGEGGGGREMGGAADLDLEVAKQVVPQHLRQHSTPPQSQTPSHPTDPQPDYLKPTLDPRPSTLDPPLSILPVNADLRVAEQDDAIARPRQRHIEAARVVEEPDALAW